MMDVTLYRDVYRDGLLEDTIPFWLNHAVDDVHGGFMTALGRDGTVIDTDKGMWPQGRFTWMLSTLYNTVEPREEWLHAAKHGVDFIRNHGFDDDGRMFFQVTREGAPLRKRRYAFTESFGAIAFAEYAKATGDSEIADEARRLFDLFYRMNTEPGLIPPKVSTDTRPMRGIGPYMIMMNMGRVLYDALGDEVFLRRIDEAIETIERYFVRDDLEAVMEVVGPEGEFIDHFDGRMLTPGHAIEAAWFILHEARVRDDASLRDLGTRMLDYMWQRGWDEEYGGIYYFRDVKGLPVQEYWHDMKFWWPHNETIIATLLAYSLTGDTKYAEWHKQVHDWSYAHFPDTEFGEWYGYLHRDGRISVDLKGNLWKGPFHLPRMQWYCWQLCEAMMAK